MVTAELVGVQEPRVLWLPPSHSIELGVQAVELARDAGLSLDPWQEWTLIHSLATREDGKWAALEVGINVARQNGKGSILEARELAGLFLLPEKLIVHTAHEAATSMEHFRRLLELIEECHLINELNPRGGVTRSHGDEGIELKNRSRIRFRTRTKGGGRGFSGDLVVLDEAMQIPVPMRGALLPTIRARPNPQLWYTGSAVDQTVHEHGIVFASVRKRGHAGGDPRLMYAEWSAEGEIEDAEDLITDRQAWAQANPGLGIRIDEEHVEAESKSMDPRTFAVELLGVGDWPQIDGLEKDRLTSEEWLACKDRKSRIVGPVTFAFDVTPTRFKTAIAAAGYNPDGLVHVETVEHKSGTGWVVQRLVELTGAHENAGVICDTTGPAASLLADLANAGIEVIPVNAREHAQACGALFDAVKDRTIRHLGTPELTSAIKGAQKRPLGDAWAWSRKSSTIDISPLVAVTLAKWGSETREPVVDLSMNVW